MYKIDRKGGGSKNRILGQTQESMLFQLLTFLFLKCYCHQFFTRKPKKYLEFKKLYFQLMVYFRKIFYILLLRFF